MSDPSKAKPTALYEDHLRAGGRMVPFAGYSLPVQYEGIAAEHLRVRKAVGLFDVSHMGEVAFTGPRAQEAVQRLVTNDIAKAAPGRAVYTPVCLPHGGIVDDMIVYKRSEEDLMICVNAANRAKDFQWFVDQVGAMCEIRDLSDEYSQIAVQGPAAPELLVRVLGGRASGMKPFTFRDLDYRQVGITLATTGYTGEKGGEIYVPNAVASALWNELLEKGADLDVGPIGLGARDTLRLEMNYCLYGNDIDETTNPLEAGIGWTVKLDKGDFIGRDALVRVKEEGLRRSLVAFKVEGKGIPRHGYGLFKGDEHVGEVTSGTLSPSLKVPIGLAYVNVPHNEVGTVIDLDLKGLRRVSARIVAPPLYSPVD
ncbi:MAG: glycine cleavage system aminomethyltransferase GcvT [Deltaproteobacteria bacterium]|nr:glycine cleavage system aminomethyltransferase GcvT [Deltaproteobacteria bacterium]